MAHSGKSVFDGLDGRDSVACMWRQATVGAYLAALALVACSADPRASVAAVSPPATVTAASQPQTQPPATPAVSTVTVSARNLPPVRCGGAERCPADKPWCVWDVPAQTGTCVPRRDTHAILRCSSERDCEQESACCWMGIEGGDSFCGSICMDLGASTVMLCSSDSECYYINQLVRAALTDKRPWRCVPIPDGAAPPGYKACIPPEG